VDIDRVVNILGLGWEGKLSGVKTRVCDVVSEGADEHARKNLESMVPKCFNPEYFVPES
jgi:hypothetical protein